MYIQKDDERCKDQQQDNLAANNVVNQAQSKRGSIKFEGPNSF